jgi:hypothetical protein
MPMELNFSNARFGKGPLPGTQVLILLCPKCQKHEFSVNIWSGNAGEVLSGDQKVRFWHAEQGPLRDWATLSLSPSLDREGLGDKCGGWHGTITNGVCTP